MPLGRAGLQFHSPRHTIRLACAIQTTNGMICRRSHVQLERNTDRFFEEEEQFKPTRHYTPSPAHATTTEPMRYSAALDESSALIACGSLRLWKRSGYMYRRAADTARSHACVKWEISYTLFLMSP